MHTYVYTHVEPPFTVGRRSAVGGRQSEGVQYTLLLMMTIQQFLSASTVKKFLNDLFDLCSAAAAAAAAAAY